MKPISLSEQLLFNTVRLVATDGSSGTGFFYNFKIGDFVYPTFITNKHVVRYNPNEQMTFFLHLQSDDGETIENQQVSLDAKWVFHSKKDLCFCFVNPLFEEVLQKTGKHVFYIANDESILATDRITEELSALEELVMVGYPIGLWDEKNNFPIFRRGYTASHPAYDFNEDGIGLVDMACFPGSSGSPIYVFNEGGYRDKKGNMYLGQSRLIFLGILFAGPQYDATGNVVVTVVPTATNVQSHTPIMTNLGYYIKAKELKEFQDYIESISAQ